MLTDLTLKEFIDKTRGNDPVPGGGSISALNGSISAALGEMVARLTIGRKKFADREADMQLILAELEPVCDRLLEAVDRDSEAYATVFAAFKLPKDTDEEKAARTATIQAATKGAAEVPMQVARLTVSIMPRLEALAHMGNPNAVTDAAVATMCARTATLGALLNVRINLSSITDSEYVDAMNLECADLEHQAVSIEERVLEFVRQTLQPSDV